MSGWIVLALLLLLLLLLSLAFLLVPLLLFALTSEAGATRSFRYIVLKLGAGECSGEDVNCLSAKLDETRSPEADREPATSN